MDRTRIAEVKKRIEVGDLPALQRIWVEHQNQNSEYENYAYLFKTFFLHACLHQQLEIAQWLYDLYEQFDIVAQCALRQNFTYARYLCERNQIYKKKNEPLVDWLGTVIKENQAKFKVITVKS